MVLDFGEILYAFVHGVAAGGLPNAWWPIIFGTKGTIAGGRLAEHARHIIEIFDAAYHSAETGQAQIPRTTFEPIS
jgi:hypothetical protein